MKLKSTLIPYCEFPVSCVCEYNFFRWHLPADKFFMSVRTIYLGFFAFVNNFFSSFHPLGRCVGWEFSGRAYRFGMVINACARLVADWLLVLYMRAADWLLVLYMPAADWLHKTFPNR